MRACARGRRLASSRGGSCLTVAFAGAAYHAQQRAIGAPLDDAVVPRVCHEQVALCIYGNALRRQHLLGGVHATLAPLGRKLWSKGGRGVARKVAAWCGG